MFSLVADYEANWQFYLKEITKLIKNHVIDTSQGIILMDIETCFRHNYTMGII